jgi:hypothetical protein
MYDSVRLVYGSWRAKGPPGKQASCKLDGLEGELSLGHAVAECSPFRRREH